MRHSHVEPSTEGFEETLGVIAESQRRIEQRLEEVWQVIAATSRHSHDGGGAGLGAEVAPAASPLQSAPDGEQSRGWAGELQDGEDEGAEDEEDQKELDLSEIENSNFLRRPSVNSSDSGDDFAWRLPEEWPENLRAKTFGQRGGSANKIVKTFTEAMSDRVEGLKSRSHLWEASMSALSLKEAYRSLSLNPHGTPRLIFDLASCAILVYDVVALPFMLAWDIPLAGSLWWITLSVDIFWVVDLVLNFFTGYHSGGVLIMEPEPIVKHYAKSWFVPDLIVLTFNAVGLWLSQYTDVQSGMLKSARYAKLARLLRVSSLMRMIKWGSIVERITDRAQMAHRMEFLEVLGCLGLIVFINHVMACTWFAIGQSSQSDTGRSWLQTPVGDGRGPEAETYETAGVLYQYLSSMHWSMTQMTPGSLQIHPENSLERAFTVLCLLCGMVFFGSIVSSLTATMTKHRLQRQERAKGLNTLHKLLQQNQIPAHLMIAAQKQGMERLAPRHRRVEADVRSMTFLAEGMRTMLHYELIRRHLLHPLLRWWEVADTDAVQRLCYRGINQVSLQRDDSLFHAGSDATCAYIVTSGSLMYTQDRQTARVQDRVETSVVEDMWLCEVVLWADWIHVGSAEAECCSEVLSVSAEEFKHAVESSRVTTLVFQQYGAAFHARLLSAQPPSSRYPTDLEVPCCSFEEIVPSLPLSARILVSGPAFRQLRVSSSRWMRPGLIKDLAEQVQEGKCTLALSADKVIERLVLVVALKLRRPDGRFLVELVDNKADWNVECKLPGTKQREGETPKQTISRLAATLEPHSSGMVWSSTGCVGDRVCKTIAHLRSVYFRETYEALTELEPQEAETRRVSTEIVPGGLVVLTEDPGSEFVPDCGAAHFRAYAWLDEDEFCYFQSDRGRKHLSTCLEAVKAEVYAAAADGVRALHV